MNATAAAQPALAAQLRRLLSQATGATVPGGILLSWGASGLPDGARTAPALTRTEWESTYFRLANGALAPGVVRPLAEVQAITRELGADDPVPIAIASFRVATPRARLMRDVRAAAAAGTALAHPPDTLAAALEERRVFAATAMMPAQWGVPEPLHRGGPMTFVVDERLHLTNPGAPPPRRVELDLADGRGFQEVAPGTPVTVDFGAVDEAVVGVRCLYDDTALTARLRVGIGGGAPPPAPDDVWPLAAAAEDGRPGNTGRAWVYRSAGRSEVRHPILIVEGFPGGHARDYLYELLNQAGTLEALRAAGYDVVIVGLDNGADLVQRNAGVLIAAMREAMRRTGFPLVVGGMSLGGVISRYALAQLEAGGESHATRIYVSIDAPHGGAYTSLGVQWFVQSLVPFLPGLAGFAALLDAPGNQQMMLSWLHEGTPQVSPLRHQLLSDLEGLGGYPRHARRIAVSCGRGDGVDSAPAGARTLAWDGAPFVSATLGTLPGDGAADVIAQGSWFLAEPPELTPLTAGGDVAWEFVPGGRDIYNAEVAGIAAGLGCGVVDHAFDVTCSVPTVSALDIDQNPCLPVTGADGPFDAYTCSPADELHLTITPEVSAWLLNELGRPPDGADARG